MTIKEETKMDKIVSLCKRKGFIYQGSEIYGGLTGTWDYGHLGVHLKNNIKQIWWRRFLLNREDMYGVDAAILMNQKVWQASGHVGGFSDPMVECQKCKKRFREDQLEKENQISKKCPECGDKLGDIRQFNMMFKTNVGAINNDDSISYLRPETAQGMFVNFRNIIDSFHPKLPFGLAQIGKAFRNEIAPRDFLFRSREFEQMEIEYFVNPDNWEEIFEHFRKEIIEFIKEIGLDKEKVHEINIKDEDRAFYSKKTIDFEFEFPFGQKELYGLAYRTDYDLKKHGDESNITLDYYDEENNKKFIPHCIEPSFGVDRTVLAVLSDAYTEDEIEGEKRVYMKFSPKVAPIKVAVFPLLKNKEYLVLKAKEIYSDLKKDLLNIGINGVVFDDNGNIGKRYRRQDEIGTPYCITIDFDTLEKDAGVTIRERDSGKQERVNIKEIFSFIKNKIQ